MKRANLFKLTPVLIAAVPALLIAGCGGSSSSGVPGAGLAAKVFSASAAQNITEIHGYKSGALAAVTIVDASKELESAFGPTSSAAELLRIGNYAYTLEPKGPTGTGSACYASKPVPWERSAKDVLPVGATVTSVSGHTINFKTANGVTHGSFEFNSADLIVGEQATISGVPVKYSWTYSYPASPPATLVSTPPSNICAAS